MALNVSNPAEVRALTATMLGYGSITIHGYSNAVAFGAITDTGDFTKSTYSGYGSGQSATFGTPATDGTGRAYVQSGTISFPLASTGTQTMNGWYAVNAAGDYLFGEAFAAPVTVSTTVAPPGFSIKYTLRQEP